MGQGLKKGLTLVALALLVGCHKWGGLPKYKQPEKALHRFIEISANVSSTKDKKKLLNLSTATVYNTLKNMSEEDFLRAYASNQLTIKSFRILKVSEKKQTQKLIEYEVVIENHSGTIPTEETLRRQVLLLKQKDHWLIAEIKPISPDKLTFKEGMIF